MKQQIIPGFNGKYEITEDGKVFSKNSYAKGYYWYDYNGYPSQKCDENKAD